MPTCRMRNIFSCAKHSIIPPYTTSRAQGSRKKCNIFPPYILLCSSAQKSAIIGALCPKSCWDVDVGSVQLWASCQLIISICGNKKALWQCSWRQPIHLWWRFQCFATSCCEEFLWKTQTGRKWIDFKQDWTAPRSYRKYCQRFCSLWRIRKKDWKSGKVVPSLKKHPTNFSCKWAGI